MAETAFASPNLGRSAVNLARQNCKAKHLFADIACPSAGEGHCEIEHRVVKINDPNAAPFKEQRKDIITRLPTVALLVISDLEELPAKQRASALSFVLTGRGPDNVFWGLMDAGPFALDIYEIALSDYGTPQV